jgi:hypothetical protein
MIWPGIRRRPRQQRIFQLAVAPLHHPIAAWVKSRGGNVLDVQPLAQHLPDRRPELGAAVRGDDRRHTKAADPAGDQGIRILAASMFLTGMASTHLVDRSMMVKRYLNPSTDVGSSPTKSTWR